MAIVLFEDALADQLWPVTATKPAYDICCGGNRLYELLQPLGQPIHGLVRDYLRGLQAVRYPAISSDPPATGEMHLLVNTRLVPSPAAFSYLQTTLEAAEPWAMFADEQLVAAQIRPSQSLRELVTADNYDTWIDENVARRDVPDELVLLEHTHDIIVQHVQLAASGIEHYAHQAGLKQLADGVFAADESSFGPSVVTHTKDGPIVVEEGAQILPNAVLMGPVLIGKNAKVIEFAAIKDGTVLGHTTKVGGEVEGSIIEPFTNKQHFGFLGHSYVGSWINLGAGTSNSDLKNTYGTVRFKYEHERIDTGQQFLGCVLGDFVKTAIQTGIFTGRLIGPFSNLYGFVTENVPAFVNYAKHLGSSTACDPKVVAVMQQRMFVRRKVEQQPCDIDVIKAVFAATQHQREGLEVGPPRF